MNLPKCDAFDYLQFLIAAQRQFTCTEAARCQPDRPDTPAHDAFTRLLARQPSDTTALWQEAAVLVNRRSGLLVLDDSTLDKPYARKTALICYHWSGKHQRVVKGINLLTLLWTDGTARVPCDFRVYDKPCGGHTKNQHFVTILDTARQRGFHPAYVLFDSWYASLANLKKVRACGWHFLTRLKSNRLVNPDGTANVPICRVPVGAEGRVVHLKGFGVVKVFRTVAPNGDAEYWATNDLALSEVQRAGLAHQGWGIKVYHRGLKQCCGVEKAQVRRTAAVLGHLLLAVRAYVHLEAYRLRTGISSYEAKAAIVRDAIRAYLAHPCYTLASTA
jgi:putative transposase